MLDEPLQISDAQFVERKLMSGESVAAVAYRAHGDVAISSEVEYLAVAFSVVRGKPPPGGRELEVFERAQLPVREDDIAARAFCATQVSFEVPDGRPRAGRGLQELQGLLDLVVELFNYHLLRHEGECAVGHASFQSI